MAHKTDVLYSKKWGVFTHFLYGEQNNSDGQSNMGAGRTDWNVCVDEFNVNKFAKQLSEIGANYLFFTIMQGTRFMCAPNEVFNKISGYKTGEACPNRDLILDIYDALKPYGIDLYLYFTGDGPHFDEVAGAKFGFTAPRKNVSKEFVEKWAEVAREYAQRYGDKIKGWWFDGCYAGDNGFNYTDELLKIYSDAVKSGNPDTLVAFNNGVFDRVLYYSIYDDFTAGEMNDFVDIPDNRFINGVQWHTIAPIGVSTDGSPWTGWCKRGAKRNSEYMKDYVAKVNSKGGVVTIDIYLGRDGTLDKEQVDLLKILK